LQATKSSPSGKLTPTSSPHIWQIVPFISGLTAAALGCCRSTSHVENTQQKKQQRKTELARTCRQLLRTKSSEQRRRRRRAVVEALVWQLLTAAAWLLSDRMPTNSSSLCPALASMPSNRGDDQQQGNLATASC